MQHSRQKRGEVRAGDAAPERGLGAAKTPERGEQIGRQHRDAVRSTVRESGFREGPDALVGVQFRRVGRQELVEKTLTARKRVYPVSIA